MKPGNFERVRGILSVRAEAAPQTPAEAWNQISAAFTDFRQRNDERLSTIESALDTQLAQSAAARIGPQGDRIHAEGFPGHARVRPLSASVATNFKAMLQGMPNAAMSVGSDPGGGYTVPVEVDKTIDGILRDISPLRQYARVVQITEGSDWDKIINRTGAQSAWAGETSTRSDTDSPVLGKVTIHPWELYAVPALTNHVIEDSSFDLQAFLAEDVSGEFALTEGTAFVTGTGIQQPKGFTVYDTSTDADSARAFGTLQYVASGSSGAFPGSNPADKLIDLMTALKPAYRMGEGVAWSMNSTTASVVRKIKDGNGSYVWINSLVAGQPDRLLGYPVMYDEGMPDIGANSLSIAFGNWRRGYAIVDKPGTKLVVDKVTQKGWTKLYFAKRVGGGVTDSNAIKLMKFAAS